MPGFRRRPYYPRKGDHPGHDPGDRLPSAPEPHHNRSIATSSLRPSSLPASRPSSLPFFSLAAAGPGQDHHQGQENAPSDASIAQLYSYSLPFLLVAPERSGSAAARSPTQDSQRGTIRHVSWLVFSVAQSRFTFPLHRGFTHVKSPQASLERSLCISVLPQLQEARHGDEREAEKAAARAGSRKEIYTLLRCAARV